MLLANSSKGGRQSRHSQVLCCTASYLPLFLPPEMHQSRTIRTNIINTNTQQTTMKTIAYLTLTGLAHVQSAHIRGSNGAAAVADPAQVAAAIDAHDKDVTKFNDDITKLNDDIVKVHAESHALHIEFDAFRQANEAQHEAVQTDFVEKMKTLEDEHRVQLEDLARTAHEALSEKEEHLHTMKKTINDLHEELATTHQELETTHDSHSQIMDELFTGAEATHTHATEEYEKVQQDVAEIETQMAAEGKLHCEHVPESCNECKPFAHCADPDQKDDACAHVPEHCEATCGPFLHCMHQDGDQGGDHDGDHDAKEAEDKKAADENQEAEDAAKAQEAEKQKAEEQEAEEQEAADKAAYEAENQGEDKAKAQEALQEAKKQKAEEQEAAEKAADEAEKQEAEVQKAAEKAADEAREWGAQEQTAADKAAFGSGAWAPGPHAKKADEAEKQAPEEKGYPKTKYSERWTPKMENEYLARKKQKAADKAADEKMSQNTQPTYGSRRL